MRDLYEVTTYESGIIIYPDQTSLVTNWAAFNIDGLPRLFCGTVIGLGEELEVVETKKLSQDAIKQVVSAVQDGLTVISDTDDSLTPEDVTSDGKMYKIISNGEIYTIITVDDWH